MIIIFNFCWTYLYSEWFEIRFTQAMAPGYALTWKKKLKILIYLHDYFKAFVLQKQSVKSTPANNAHQGAGSMQKQHVIYVKSLSVSGFTILAALFWCKAVHFKVQSGTFVKEKLWKKMH